MINLNSQIEKIKPEDICLLLEKKFNEEKMDRFFSIDNHFSFRSNLFNLTSSNSILLRFKGLNLNSSYNLLLIFSIPDEDLSKIKLQNQIRRISENNIDKIVIWTRKQCDGEILQALKRCHANVIYINKSEIAQVKFISSFYPHGKDYNYAVILNKITDLFVVRLKKLFHLVLSEIAAPTYDDNYGREKVGTSAIMDFEEEILNRTIKYLQYKTNRRGEKLSIAVDVGCGTGRHSRNVLSDKFCAVYGFDFSPKMIDFANDRKRKEDRDNLVYSIADLEYEEIMYEDEYYNKADLVVASFGMGSFIEDTARMLRRFYEWLKPGGMLFISFYNRNSIILNLTPNWRDTSLSAHIDLENNSLNVELSKDTVFQIFCKPYDDDIKTEIAKKFDVDSIYSFPTALALLPNSLLQNKLAKELFTKVDKYLSTDKNSFLGHYVIVTARKPQIEEIDGYKNIISILNKMNIDYEIIEHDVVLSINDVLKEVDGIDGILVKSLVFHLVSTNTYIIIALPHEKRINKQKLAKQIKINSKKLNFAHEKEIAKLGFPPGGIPPFGFSETADVKYFIHPYLKERSQKPLYMGTGDNRKTLKLNWDAFHLLTKDHTLLYQT